MRLPMEGAEEQEQPSTSGKMIGFYAVNAVNGHSQGYGSDLDFAIKVVCQMSHCMQNCVSTFTPEHFVWNAQQSICHFSHLASVRNPDRNPQISMCCGC